MTKMNFRSYFFWNRAEELGAIMGLRGKDVECGCYQQEKKEYQDKLVEWEKLKYTAMHKKKRIKKVNVRETIKKTNAEEEQNIMKEKEANLPLITENKATMEKHMELDQEQENFERVRFENEKSREFMMEMDQ
jgi:hypothetical protein